MALAGDLGQLHIADIIQLIHTTRKSGTFSVKGDKGESRIIFSNGYIVGANHLNNKIRIGTVLVKVGAITVEDLKQALNVQMNAGKDRKPLIATLLHLGKVNNEAAQKGLSKLIEMTIVELIGWTKGSFIFDTEAIAVSPQCNYHPGRIEQEVSLDTQMVLMDALRIFDEQEHDRSSGKVLPSYEELFSDVVPSVETLEVKEKSTDLTADVLGLADIDRLERKIPEPVSIVELFDPVEIHRQKTKEILADFRSREQEVFVSFLAKFITGVSSYNALARRDDRTNAIIFLSKDELIKHSVMTICKNDGIMVFTATEEDKLEKILLQCLSKEIVPILVFDNPERSKDGLSEEKVTTLRQKVKEKYPQLSVIQFASVADYNFTIQSFNDGIRTVLPKPLKEENKESFVADTIKFLETLRTYIKGIIDEQSGISATNSLLSKLRDRIVTMRGINEPPDVFLAILQFVSALFERSITFIVGQNEIKGDRALGVNAAKKAGTISATNLKIPLSKYSVFRDVLETGQFFYGQSEDEVLKKHLFKEIGAPLRPTMVLLPVKSSGKVIALIYGDYGKKEVLPIRMDVLEILTHYAGAIIENTLYRKHLNKAMQK
jgi:hypothetical protein